MLTWAVTRAAAESRQLVEQLHAEGLRAVSLPCIERVSLPVAPWVPDARARLVMLTSVAAVEAVADQLPVLKSAEVAALGPTTANAVRALGLEVAYESSGGVVALARMVVEALSARGALHQTACWYPTSAAGVESAEQHEAMGVLASLGSVARVEAYDVVAPRGLERRLVNQFVRAPAPTAVLFSSPTAVRHFSAAAQATGSAAVVPALVACWGESTRALASRHFARSYLVPRSQPLAASLQALEALTVSSKPFTSSETRHG